ncbi:hypothetical protein [Paraburkholderia edwinii]|uniref:hypothetical protein n=1 Tax=Paraburkholderia edwinii TaxID=2861782 RepID=UPI003CCEAD16
MQTMRGRPTLAVSVREHYRRERFIGQRFVPAQQIKVVFEDIELPERRTRKTVRAMWAGPNVIDDAFRRVVRAKRGVRIERQIADERIVAVKCRQWSMQLQRLD